MKSRIRTLHALLFSLCLVTSSIAYAGDNQTDDLSPILPGRMLPFRISIEQANFQLPVGLHSGAFGIWEGLWVFIAGRTNGMHGFGPDPFPVEAQNRSVYVVNPNTGSVISRSLTDAGSGLSQAEIDTLSVTSPESYQNGSYVYMAGGYGIDTATASFSTKPVITSINLPALIKWVTQPSNRGLTAKKCIKQIYNPFFQVAGGRMVKSGQFSQLIFGQNFQGVYTSSSNGYYTEQVRIFKITDTGDNFSISIVDSKPHILDPNYRRRDLNILPAITFTNNEPRYSTVAFAGVFTPATGVWTVPVFIDNLGSANMPDPNLPTTFKQSMNQYACATVGLYSSKYKTTFNLFFGGLSFGFFDSGTFQTDAEIPFINQVTAIAMDKDSHFTQYLMDGQYPVITSTTINPGNTLLFGAGAFFMFDKNLLLPGKIIKYPNGMLTFDIIKKPTVIGYIVGGIASTLPNTNTQADSFASKYVFKVTLTPT